MNVSPNILAKDWKFKIVRHGFVDERALITTTSISFCHWKTLLPFCLREKRPENAFLTHRKTEKQNYAMQNNNNWPLKIYNVI